MGPFAIDGRQSGVALNRIFGDDARRITESEPTLRRAEIEIEPITEIDVDALLLDERKISIIDEGIQDVTSGRIPGHRGAQRIARRRVGDVAASERVDETGRASCGERVWRDV